MKTRKILLWITGAIVAVFVVVAGLFIIYVRPVWNEMKTTKTIPFDKQLTLVLGGGGNSGILTSDSLVLVIDTKMSDAVEPFYAEVKQLAGNRHIIAVNTHVHRDHTAGNILFKGQTIIAGGNYDKAFWIADAGEQTLPTQWVKDSLVLNVGDETVTILNLGFNAHTQSDLVVFLKNRKLIFTGDLVLNKQCPALFKKYNASSAGYIRAFDLIEKRFDIRTVVPGHGNVGGADVIDKFRTFFEDMLAAVKDDSKRDEMQEKYKTWRQVPFMMSPGATIRYMKAEMNK